MNRTYKILGLVVAFLLILPTLSLAAQFLVTRVHDGNTVEAVALEVEGGPWADPMVTVSLAGIDAPETSKGKRQLGQPYSRKAKKHLAGLVLNKVADIKSYGFDRYNRMFGVIYLDGQNINLEMVKAGLAEVYRGRPPEGFDITPYLEAEKEAREAKRGMWSLGEDYISPRKWLKMHRES